MHILIVDDDEFNRLLLEVIIQKTTHTFQTATNGLEAIQATQKHYFDLIFMDVHIPIMNGIETIKQIRQNSRFQQSIIVIVTADPTALLEIDSYTIGINGFLLKPISIKAVDSFLS